MTPQLNNQTLKRRSRIWKACKSALVHFVEKVRRTTSSDIERTAAIWLPKYEATSHIVNELSFEVEQMDNKFPRNLLP
jgi:hypothetical protein